MKKDKCKIPRTVPTDSWTIHGLWPSRTKGKAPKCCDSSLPFDEGQIKDLRCELETFWPNLLADESKTELWKHEWEKHGTCGMDVEAVNTQEKYFDIGLALNRDLNIYQMLKDHGIVPSSSIPYQYDDIANAFVNTFDIETPPKMACHKDEENSGTVYLYQVYFCLKKNLELMDCPKKASYSPGKICELAERIFIPPFDRLNILHHRTP
ncbi:ribonuclease Oy-like [Ptychodera flava]|uniref:ribonuclease Oy-like n=1 Tax=Ptychodera flava TaxID=63121 RepID=UPI003969D678